MVEKLGALAFVVLLGSCGDIGTGFFNGTACGESLCAVGNYCADEEFSSCLPGCKGDENCEVEQVCLVPSGEVVGTCNESAEPSQAENEGVWVASCRSACQEYLFFECIDEAQGQACIQWCESATEESATTFAACEDASACNFATCFPG